MAKEQKYAKAGQELTPRAVSKLKKISPHIFEHTLVTRESITIAPKGMGKNGQWICADCGEVFQNNMGAQGHTSSHRLVWWTGERFEEA